MIRVAYGVAAAHGGGTLNYVVDLAEHHARDRFEPVVFVEEAGDGLDEALRRLAAAGVEVVRGPFGRLPPWRGHVRRWRALLRDSGPFDIANLEQPVPGEGGAFLAAARQIGVPLLVRTEQLPRFPPLLGRSLAFRRRFAIEWIERMTDWRVAVSDAGRAALLQRGAPTGTVAVVPTAYREESFADLPSRAEARRRVGLPADGLVVTFLAALNEQKRPDFFLAAAKALASEHPDAVFVVGGSGPWEERVRASLESLGPAGRFIGQRDDVPTVLAASDVYVLPSLWEGLPLTVLEAMRAGALVVASAVDGTPEVVQDHETGRLFAAGDANALVTVLGEVLANAAGRAAMAAAGRRFVTGRYDAATLARRTEEFYGEALERSGR